jgi:magnesium transporter
MTAQQAAAMIAAVPAVTAAGTLRLLPRIRRDEISAHLPQKSLNRIQRQLNFPPTSVGAIMNARIDVLPESITVAEAARRVARFTTEDAGVVFVIDDSHRLVGSLDVGKLLKSNQRDRLSSVMNARMQSLSARANIAALHEHPAWSKHRRLPVVDRDRTLLGVLEYSALQNTADLAKTAASPGALENLMALGVFYWIHAAQLLVGMFSVVTRGQGDRR